MADGLPTSSHRLFAHYQDPERLADAAPEFVIARLLEEGHTSDLRWLTRRYRESALASWLKARGARQLSPRSRSFWEIVLRHSTGPSEPLAAEIWPL